MTTSSDFVSHVQSGVAARRHPRARFSATVHLLLPQGALVEAHALDISLGGLQLVVPASIAPGTVCSVRLLIPAIPFGTHTVIAQAQVTSLVFSGKVGGFAIGLHFTSLSAESNAALAEYLQERDAHQAFQRGYAAPRVQRPRSQPARSAAPVARDGLGAS